MHTYRVQQFSDADRRQVRMLEEEAQESATREAPTIFVVNGDDSFRRSLEAVIRSAGWEARSFPSAAAFLSCQRSAVPGCLVLDPVLPDGCGLELQEQLNGGDEALSTIFITEQADVQTTVRAMKAGAIEVLARPIDYGVLLGAIDEAIEVSRAALNRRSTLEALRKDHALLTAREREVMALVVSGLLNKQVAYELGISQITVKAHRGRVMRKMRARSFVDLVQKASQLARGFH